MSNTPLVYAQTSPSDTSALRQLLVKLLQSDTVTSLSFTDPWGTAVAVGAKKVETRSWAAPERHWEHPIAIHVSGTLTAQAKAVCEEEPFYRVLESAGYSWTTRRGFGWDLPLKRIIAVAWLERVQRITSTCMVDEYERIFGNYTPGRYAWKFAAVYRLKQPVEATGRLGLWQWTPPVAFWDEIQEQLDVLPQGGPQV
jgi:hypothetical protein